MPVPLFIWGIAAILGVGAVAAITFWTKILDWAENSLFPWIERNIPSIGDAVKKAFVAVDKVTVPIRSAWKNLREYLLKLVENIELQPTKEWIKKVTFWIIKVLESGEKVVVKSVTEEVVDWEDLPADVREQFLRNEKSNTEIDVTKYRDQEIDGMDMST